MERVRITEVDSSPEVAKVINMVIDNLNQVEAKVLQLIAADRRKATTKKGVRNA